MNLIQTMPNGGKTAQSIEKMVELMLSDQGAILFNSEDEPIDLTRRVVEAFESRGGDLDAACGYVVRVGLYDTDVMEESDSSIAKFEQEFGKMPAVVIFDTNHAQKVREYFEEYVNTLTARGIEVFVTVNLASEAKDVDVKLPEYVQRELDRAVEVLAEKPLVSRNPLDHATKSNPAAELMEFLGEGDGVI